VLYSKTAQYSIQAMLFIAANYTEKNILVRDIANELKLPASFLSKILQTLSRFGFLHSVKGPRGGFSLSEKGAAASISQVVEIIDGPIDFDLCICGFSPCDSDNACPMHDAWTRIREDIKNLVNKKAILKLAQDMPDKYKPIFLKETGGLDKGKGTGRGKKASARVVPKKKR
jgi:Rrf2 family protein